MTNSKRYFADIAVILTNNFNRHNQKLLRKDLERDFKSLCMKVVPKIIKNVITFRN